MHCLGSETFSLLQSLAMCGCEDCPFSFSGPARCPETPQLFPNHLQGQFKGGTPLGLIGGEGTGEDTGRSQSTVVAYWRGLP